MPFGRRREKEKPLPPPVCWMRAASRRVWKMPAESAAHVIGDGQDETGSQLSQGGAGAGEGGGIGEEFLGGEKVVIFEGAGIDIALPGFLDLGDVVGHPPEHLFDGLARFAVVTAADVALHEHLAGILGQLDRRQIRWWGRGWQKSGLGCGGY